MLSAVENFGPVTGPANVLPYALHHNSFAFAAAAAGTTVIPQPTPLTPTTPTHMNGGNGGGFPTSQAHLEHFHQAVKGAVVGGGVGIGSSQQLPYETHLNYFLPPPPPTGATPTVSVSGPSITTTHSPIALISPPLSSPSPSIGKRLSSSSLSPNSSTLPKEELIKSEALTINEFTRPQPKLQTNNHNHHQRHSIGGITSIPHEDLKNGFASRLGYSTVQDQTVPINLVTTSSANNSNAFISSPANHFNSRPASNSSSVDIENDRSMSPPPPPSSTQSQLQSQSSRKLSTDAPNLVQKFPYDAATLVGPDGNGGSNAAAVAAAAYHLNYSQLYANRAMYNMPIIFTSTHPGLGAHVNRIRPPPPPHASFMNGIPPTHHPVPNSEHAISAAYLKAVQDAVSSGMFNPNVPSPVPVSSANGSSTIKQTTNMRSNQQMPMISLAPPPPASSASSSSSTGTMTINGPSDLRQKNAIDLKKDNSHHLPQPAIPMTKLASGTYLNDKINPPANGDNDVDNFFKVPSGKEGSMKHRILTRPSSIGEKIEFMKPSPMRTFHSTANFKKGAYIELTNGVLRRVEDMRTEDFIQCAERSPHHEITDATVVKIDMTPSSALITFSYDKNCSKADIEVPSEYPFFVYGQGWASCNTDVSLQAFGLKCQRLQVGDICISLKQRDPVKGNSNTIIHQSLELSHQHPNERLPPLEVHCSAPQTTGAIGEPLGIPISPISVTQYAQAMHNIPLHMLPPHLAAHHPYPDMAEMVHAYTTGAQISRENLSLPEDAIALHHLSPKMTNSFYAPSQHLFHAPSMPSHEPVTLHEMKSPPQPLMKRTIHQQPQPHHVYRGSPTSLSLSQHPTDEYDHCHDGHMQDQPVDASLSNRKRRWSAPESTFEDEQPRRNKIPTTEHNIMANSINHYRYFKAPINEHSIVRSSAT